MAKILGGAFVYVEGKKDEVKCVKCSKLFKYHHSTSSLRYHLLNSHGNNNKKEAESSSSSNNSIPKQLKLGFTKLSKTKCTAMTSSIAKWICKDSRQCQLLKMLACRRL